MGDKTKPKGNFMDNEFGLLNNDEVLFVRSGRILMPNATFKASEFLDALAQLVSEREDEWTDDQEGWFNEQGLACEVLRFGNQGWQRGKVRIRLEFVPEGPKLLKEAAPSKQERGYPVEDIFPPRVNFGDRPPRRDPRSNRGSDSYPNDSSDFDDEY